MHMNLYAICAAQEPGVIGHAFMQRNNHDLINKSTSRIKDTFKIITNRMSTYNSTYT